MGYTASKLLSGELGILRQHSFTRWLMRDLAQAAVDFNRNLGLLPVYAECTADHQVRYLFWRPPQGAVVEVRSGRLREHFEAYDSVNRERKLHLVSLHVNELEFFSAVWINEEHYETAKLFLAVYGITSAERADC